MPELVLAIISIAIALPGVALTAWHVSAHPDPLAEAEVARRAAITATAAARASAHAAHVAELDAFDAAARRILDAAAVPCVCSQVLTHEWDGHTQSYRQRWTVPEHFTACAKHWPATATDAPPRGTATNQQHQGGPMLTPAARVNAAHRAIVAEWARRVTGPQPLRWADYAATRSHRAAALDRRADDDWYGVRYTPGGARYRYPTATGAGAEQQRQGGPPLPRDERLAAAMLRELSTTTYGVPDDCTCVLGHTRAALANTHVVHRVDCATNRGSHAAEWRPMGDNG